MNALLDRPSSTSVPTLDPTFGDALASQLREDVQDGNFGDVVRRLAQEPDPDRLALCVSALAHWEGRPEFLDRFERSDPNNPFVWLVGGAHAIEWAWEARGRGKVETVSWNGRQLFIERLQIARDKLLHAAKLAPSDPTPYAFLLKVCLGLNITHDDTMAVFRDAVQRHPEHLLAHRHLLSYLCQKWHGSHQQMFEFARLSAEDVEDGSLLPVLVAEAHIERWLYAVGWEDDPESHEYFLRPEVRAEITSAHERSLGSTAHRQSATSQVVANVFAFALSRAELAERAATAFDQTQGRVSYLPWSLEGDPVERYTVHRDRVSESTLGPRVEPGDTPTDLGPLVHRCRKESPATFWRAQGGNFLVPLVLPIAAALVATVALVAVMAGANMIGKNPEPKTALMVIGWFAAWTLGLYTYFYSAPGEGSFDIHTNGCRYQGKVILFRDLKRIEFGRVNSGFEKVTAWLSEQVAPSSRGGYVSPTPMQVSESQSLALHFRDGSSWSMNNVVAEYAPGDAEAFVRAALTQYPELDALTSFAKEKG